MATVSLMLLAAAPSAHSGAPAPLTWTTLGTAGGPIVFGERSQPANLLRSAKSTIVVDCGDGCVERLAAAGVTTGNVDAVLISHLHQDHVAGLAGLVGLRWMQTATTPLTIYGPAGIDRVVAGILQSIEPSERIGLPSGGLSPLALKDMVKVVILRDGADTMIGSVRVRAVRNTHFDLEGQPAANGSESLSFRFDLDGRSIGFTGDTGPSPAVTRLFAGSGLIVSETADLAAAAAAINASGSPVPASARTALLKHIEEHHLSPAQAGTLATAAGARCLVLTHLSIPMATSGAAGRLASQSRSTFEGEINVARDQDRFSTPLSGLKTTVRCRQ